MEPSGEIYATIAWQKFIEKINNSDTRTENAKNELEKIQAIGKERMKHMKETEQRITQKWIECLEDNASLEAQQAYCQGYIDCLFLLCGMGIIEKDSVANDIFDQLNK